MSCDGNCYAEWAYQSIWFEWQDDYYYDLSSKTCVQQWDSITQVAVNHTMFGNKLVCREFDYYVDSLSSEVVELGTSTYPYKDLNSVFVELINLHGGESRNLTVYIKEDTWNILYVRKNLIIGISKIVFKSYSEDDSSNSKAIIIGTDNTALTVTYVMPTMFNILSNKTMLLSDLYSKLGNYSIGDMELIGKELSTFTISASNVAFENLKLLTSHKLVQTNNFFFRIIKSKLSLFELKNLIINVSGTIFYWEEQTISNLEDLVIDYYRTFRGFYYDMYCDNPTEFYDSVTNINNLTLYYSQKAVISGERLFLANSGKF